VTKNGIKSQEYKCINHIPTVIALLRKCREFAGFVNRNSLKPSFSPTIKPAQACRWGCDRENLWSVLKNISNGNIKAVLDKRPTDNAFFCILLQNDSITIMYQLYLFLDAFQEATLILEVTNKPSLHKVIRTYCSLVEHCSKFRLSSILDPSQEKRYETHPEIKELALRACLVLLGKSFLRRGVVCYHLPLTTA